MQKPLAIVLAAGKGTRMKSDLPKVLCEICERPMIAYVIETLRAAGVDRIICVVGYRSDLVRETLQNFPFVEFVEQTEQLGTGHAVMVCRERLIDHDGPVIVVAGDSPMLQQTSVETLLKEFERVRPACILGTIKKENPQGLGRIVRNAAGDFTGIVEEKDATPEQKQIDEVNMSTYVFAGQKLLGALAKLSNNNHQGEYYLTDCPGIFVASDETVLAMPILKPCESLSINTVDELQIVQQAMIDMKR
jgi:bifunctional UDP-N-acetylglucosamine pyrophosphorylase/glucosamine-1-phosphate N-acetyltransferase/UDP-N-acetylglucosamine pyrophosphorylase